MTRQCDNYSTSMQRQCAYVEGHSGEHLYPHGNEDLSDEIRLKLLRDNCDTMTADLEQSRARHKMCQESLAATAAERDALIVRRDELLAAMVRVTRETPYPEEAGNAGVLLAEVGTLRAALATAQGERDAARAQLAFAETRLTSIGEAWLSIERDTASAIAAYILGGEVANLTGVDLTDPDCPRGEALTIAARCVRDGMWRPERHTPSPPATTPEQRVVVAARALTADEIVELRAMAEAFLPSRGVVLLGKLITGARLP